MASTISAHEFRAHMRSNFHLSGCRPAPEINIRERLTFHCTSVFHPSNETHCSSCSPVAITEFPATHARRSLQSARPTLRLTKSRTAGQPLELEHRSDACKVCLSAYPRTARDRDHRQYRKLIRPQSARLEKTTAMEKSVPPIVSVCPVKAPMPTTEEWLDSLKPPCEFDPLMTLEPWEVSSWDTELLSSIVRNAECGRFCI